MKYSLSLFVFFVFFGIHLNAQQLSSPSIIGVEITNAALNQETGIYEGKGEKSDPGAQILKISNTIYRYTPQRHISGEKQFEVILQSTSEDPETGKVTVMLNDQEIGKADFNLSSMGIIREIPFTITLPELSVGPLDLRVVTTLDNQPDASPKDTIILKNVSDSTFVGDYKDENWPIGIGVSLGSETDMSKLEVTVGMIFELSQRDTLTSVNIGFGYNDSDADFGILVYPVEEGDFLVLGKPITRQSFSRPRAGGDSRTFELSHHTIMESGKYYFAVQQFTTDFVRVGCDFHPDGGFWSSTLGAGDTLVHIQSRELGNIHVRPNFGKPGTNFRPTEVKENLPNLQLLLYPNPAQETVTLNSNRAIKTISVCDIAGRVVYSINNVDSLEYTLNVQHLASGIYFVLTQTDAGLINSKLIVK